MLLVSLSSPNSFYPASVTGFRFFIGLRPKRWDDREPENNALSCLFIFFQCLANPLTPLPSFIFDSSPSATSVTNSVPWRLSLPFFEVPFSPFALSFAPALLLLKFGDLFFSPTLSSASNSCHHGCLFASSSFCRFSLFLLQSFSVLFSHSL